MSALRMFLFALLLPVSLMAQSLPTPDLLQVDQKIRIQWPVIYHEQAQTGILERSLDGNQFESIYQFPADLFFSGAEVMSFDDERLQSGNTYTYRLRLLVENQEELITPERSIQFESRRILFGDLHSAELSIDDILLDIDVRSPLYVNISVIQAKGGLEIFSDRRWFSDGRHILRITHPPLKEGMYYLRLETEEQIEFREFWCRN